MKLSQLRDAFLNHLECFHPHLAKHCHVDVRFDSASPFSIVFWAEVEVKSSKDYRAILEALGNPIPPPPHILAELDEYQAWEPEDLLEPAGPHDLKITIGDGDDTGAVVTLGPWAKQVWLRALM